MSITRIFRAATTRIAAGVALAAIVTLNVAGAAHADVEAQVSDLRFTTTTVQQGRSAVLTGTWSVPDDATDTATFQLSLPAELRGQAQSFRVTAADGNDTGECVVTASTFRCEINLTSGYYLGANLHLREPPVKQAQPHVEVSVVYHNGYSLPTRINILTELTSTKDSEPIHTNGNVGRIMFFANPFS